MAIVILIVGVVVFGIGIVGQVNLGRRRSQSSNAGDRRSARLVLTLAALIIGAWMAIASSVALLHSHAHSHASTQSAS